MKLDGEGTFIDAIKKSEDGSGYIVRLYDSVNSRKHHTLTFGVPVKEAYLCDLLENELEQLEVKNKNVGVNVNPFEIVTLKVKF